MSTDYTHFDKLAFNRLFAFGPDNSETLIINSLGQFVGVVATASLGNGSAASPSLYFTSAPTTGIYKGTSSAFNISVAGVQAVTIASTLAATFAGALSASNLSGTNTGDNVAASTSTAGIVSTGAQSFAGIKSFISNVRIGTATTVDTTAEGLSVLYNLTSDQSATQRGIAARTLMTSNSAISNSVNGGYFSASRTVTADVTDTARLASGVFQTIINSDNGHTYTNTDSSAIEISALSKAGAGSIASNYKSIFIRNDTTAVTGRKTAVRIGSFSGGTTGNAFIADNESFSGSYFINSSSTNASVFSGAMTIGSGTTQQHTLNSLLATNGSAAMTLLNGPAAASAGNPVGWIQITVNGTTRYMPFW